MSSFPLGPTEKVVCGGGAGVGEHPCIDGQRLEYRLLLGEHGAHLTLGRAVDSGVRPPLFPRSRYACASSSVSKRGPFSGVF